MYLSVYNGSQGDLHDDFHNNLTDGHHDNFYNTFIICIMSHKTSYMDLNNDLAEPHPVSLTISLLSIFHSHNYMGNKQKKYLYYSSMSGSVQS